MSKFLKVRYRHLDFWGDGVVRLTQQVVKTIVKHNYNLVKIDGQYYKLSVIYPMPKEKGYLPIVTVVNYYKHRRNNEYI